MHEQRLERPEQTAHHEDEAHAAATELQRVLPAVHLRHDFAEEQQQERQQHGDAKELHPCGLELHQRGKHIVAKHDDGDVHEVVGYQDGSQRSFTIFSKFFHMLVGGCLLVVDLGQVGWREAEECYLGAACEARYK